MASFGSATFGERGDGSTFPTWGARDLNVMQQTANGVHSVKSIGADVQRMTFIAKCTATERDALYSAVLESRSLTFGYETCDAFLESVEAVNEQGAGKDVYFVALNLVRL